MNKHPHINALGMAQANLEYATKELRSAQAVFKRAQERLHLAEEGHELASVLLAREVDTVRSKTKVLPAALRG